MWPGWWVGYLACDLVGWAGTAVLFGLCWLAVFAAAVHRFNMYLSISQHQRLHHRHQQYEPAFSQAPEITAVPVAPAEPAAPAAPEALQAPTALAPGALATQVTP